MNRLRVCLLSFCCMTGAARMARAQTPEAAAAAAAARAMEQASEAEAELPPPELMLEVWRVPGGRPYAIDDAEMIRIGLEQEFSAPGERAGRRRAGRLQASAVLQDGQAKRRLVALRLRHAEVEVMRAEQGHGVHVAHLKLAQQTLDLARARHAAGGSLQDVSVAEVELVRAQALVTADKARAQSGRALVAALRGATLPASGAERPELAALRLERDAGRAQAQAERSRASWPDFRIGASYFAPTMGQEHGFGISLGMKLPWLWGGRSGAARAAGARADALEQELVAKRRDLAADAVEARGAMHVAQSTLGVLTERVLPAVTQARQLSLSAYQSGRAPLADTLRIEAELLDVEMQVVELKGELAHREVDLAFAEGRAFPGFPATKGAQP